MEDKADHRYTVYRISKKKGGARLDSCTNDRVSLHMILTDLKGQAINGYVWDSFLVKVYEFF